MINDLLSKLEVGGALYLEVPHFASAVARIAGPIWPLWYVPKHLSHFTRETLRRAIAAAGGTATLGTCEMPLMGNMLALRFGRPRDDARFRMPGVALYPFQIAVEAATRQGGCLWAIARRTAEPRP